MTVDTSNEFEKQQTQEDPKRKEFCVPIRQSIFGEPFRKCGRKLPLVLFYVRAKIDPFHECANTTIAETIESCGFKSERNIQIQEEFRTVYQRMQEEGYIEASYIKGTKVIPITDWSIITPAMQIRISIGENDPYIKKSEEDKQYIFVPLSIFRKIVQCEGGPNSDNMFAIYCYLKVCGIDVCMTFGDIETALGISYGTIRNVVEKLLELGLVYPMKFKTYDKDGKNIINTATMFCRDKSCYSKVEYYARCVKKAKKLKWGVFPNIKENDRYKKIAFSLKEEREAFDEQD